MACFLIPTAEAVVTTVVTQVMKHNEKKTAIEVNSNLGEQSVHVQFTRKLQWLSNMLWGGSALLAFEHVWHGEVVAWFPFFTAVSNPSDTQAMFHEMGTSGISMALIVTAVWGVICAVTSVMEKSARTHAAAC